MKVFLGGTCNGSTWREKLIPLLEIDYFNPVVEDWTPACMEEEKRQRELCDFCLYVITPKMTGVYAIAEAVEDSIKRPEKTIFCLLAEDDDECDGACESEYSFSKSQLKSLNQVGVMVERNGGKFFVSLEMAAAYLNKAAEDAENRGVYEIRAKKFEDPLESVSLERFYRNKQKATEKVDELNKLLPGMYFLREIDFQDA